jgi:hypothetical protein
MQLGLVSIQRDRAPWLVEWFAFHYLVGFRKFYFYAHLCTDNTAELLLQLGQRFDISPFIIGAEQDGVQLAAYQHACDHYLNDVDWMCFLDGDEFLFPTADATLPEALAALDRPDISALGVYNCNFGSSGHIEEPAGLVTRNYTLRARDDFMAQRRIKSLLKGHQKVHTGGNSHLFITPHGTVDECMRPINHGYMPQYEPSYTRLRINHYVCQSRAYFLNFKKHSGHADASAAAVREEEWWNNFNTNDVADDSMARFEAPLRALVSEIHAELGLAPLPAP